jgi:hypothetical protein
MLALTATLNSTVIYSLERFVSMIWRRYQVLSIRADMNRGYGKNDLINATFHSSVDSGVAGRNACEGRWKKPWVLL